MFERGRDSLSGCQDKSLRGNFCLVYARVPLGVTAVKGKLTAVILWKKQCRVTLKIVEEK